MGYFLFIATIICSVFSQHPMFLKTSVAAVLKYFWAIPFIYNLYKYGHSKYHKIIKIYFGFCLLFIVYDVLFVPKFTIKLDSDIINMLISFLVLITSYLFWLHNRNEKFLSYMCMILLVSVSYIGFVIYIDSLSAVSFDDVEYACKSKNSIATIILSTIVICFFNMKLKSKILFFCTYSVYAFLILILFLLKSRATLVGFLFFVIYSSTKFNNKNIRNIVALIVIFFAGYILYDPDAYDVLINKIFLNNRSADDLSAVSSGRDEQIASQWVYFENNIFLGSGRGYIDSFPIHILFKYGIVGLIFMLIFLFKISKIIFNFSRENMLHVSSYLLLCIFLLNSLFEAYPPFGPGIKCCILWISVGFSCAEITSLNRSSQSYIEVNES